MLVIDPDGQFTLSVKQFTVVCLDSGHFATQTAFLGLEGSGKKPSKIKTEFTGKV